MLISRRGLVGAALMGTQIAAFGRIAAAQTPPNLSEMMAPRVPAPLAPRPGAPSPRAPAELGSGITIQETPRGTLMSVQGDVLFAFDSADLRPSSQEVLARVVAYIQQRRPPQVAVEGNTDSVGSPSYNMALGASRARAVVAFFGRSGLPLGIFTAASFGATRPVAPNTNPDGTDNPEGRARNRRVDIILER